MHHFWILHLCWGFVLEHQRGGRHAAHGQVLAGILAQWGFINNKDKRNSLLRIFIVLVIWATLRNPPSPPIPLPEKETHESKRNLEVLSPFLRIYQSLCPQYVMPSWLGQFFPIPDSQIVNNPLHTWTLKILPVLFLPFFLSFSPLQLHSLIL